MAFGSTRCCAGRRHLFQTFILVSKCQIKLDIYLLKLIKIFISVFAHICLVISTHFPTSE